MNSNLDNRHDDDHTDRIDQIGDRFEQALKSGASPQIEEFLDATDESLRKELFRELLTLELWYLRKRGNCPASENYVRRFPHYTHLVEVCFNAKSNKSETTLSRDSLASDNTRDGVKPLEEQETVAQDEEPIPAKIGRYKIIDLLGSGGFGKVYLGFDTELCRQVAIKVPRKDRLCKSADVEAYLTEARLVAKLDHRHIVPVLDAGRTHDGRCFAVSKYIEGQNLWQSMSQHKRSHNESAELVAAVADALHYAHLNEITHRDIKPANILVDKSGVPYIVDFGLALQDGNFGKPEGLKGTIPYMSPEQARRRGHLVDGRSDIFSLGTVFYELLTGSRPFKGSTAEEILDRICYAEPRPLRMIDDTIPPELERICLKCLMKSVHDRWLVASDLADALRQFLGDSEGREGFLETNLLHAIWNDMDATLQDAFSIAYNKKRRDGKNRISTRDFFQALSVIDDKTFNALRMLMPPEALPDPNETVRQESLELRSDDRRAVAPSLPRSLYSWGRRRAKWRRRSQSSQQHETADETIEKLVLREQPLLSDCITNTLTQFRNLGGLPRKLTSTDIFVDIAKHGHGPSVKRLREHGVTPTEIEKQIAQLGISVIER